MWLDGGEVAFHFFFCFLEIVFVQDWDVWEILHIEIVFYHKWTCFCHPPFIDPMPKRSDFSNSALYFTDVCTYVKVPALVLDLLHLLAEYFLF